MSRSRINQDQVRCLHAMGLTHAAIALRMGVSRRRIGQILAGDPPRKHWRSFVDARSYVHALHLRHRRDWIDYCRDGADEPKPDDIPSVPALKYPGEWKGWADWLGLKEPAPFLSYEDARRFVHTLGLETEKDWKRYKRNYRHKLLAMGVPLKPQYRYPNQSTGFYEWLGVSRFNPVHVPINPQDHPWRKYPMKIGRAYDRYVGPVLINSRTERVA